MADRGKEGGEMQKQGSGTSEQEAAAIEAEIADIDRQLNYLNYLNYSESECENRSPVRFASFDPLDQDNKKQLPPFPVEYLPDEIKGYVLAVAESLQVSADMVASFVIAIISMCVQGKYAVQTKPDWVEPINIYMVVIARPSERKSPALKEVTAPAFKYVKEENERRKPQVAGYELQKKIISGKLKTIQDSLSKPGNKTKYKLQDALDCQKELDELEEVSLLRLILDDVTPEALVKVMKENDEKIAIVSAEGGIFGTIAGRYSDKTNIDIFLKGYSGEYYSTVRIGRQGHDLEHPLITIVLAVQPQVILDIMDNQDFRGRGLLARFLYGIPPSLVGKRKYQTKPINPFIREQYEKLMYELLNIPDMFGERLIRLTPEAALISEQYNQWIEHRLTNEFEEIEDWAGKLHGNTMRIAGVFHLIKHKVDAYNVLLDAETLTAAIEVGKYYLEHSKAAFDIMGLSDPQDVKDAKYIISRLGENSLNSLNSFIPKGAAFDLSKGKFKTAEEMQPGLDVLVEHGYIAIVKEHTKKKGRPPEKIYINPEYIKYKEEQKNERSI